EGEGEGEGESPPTWSGFQTINFGHCTIEATAEAAESTRACPDCEYTISVEYLLFSEDCTYHYGRTPPNSWSTEWAYYTGADNYLERMSYVSDWRSGFLYDGDLYDEDTITLRGTSEYWELSASWVTVYWGGSYSFGSSLSGYLAADD
ncbi:MAG TPA: hypothetical protein DFR83_27830, partial [Deltaproteobacteria bacterium]|nr:hypothetical protein [Deltaproteobacteria bacterium]